MFNIFSHKENANQNPEISFHLTPVKMAKIKTSGDTSVTDVEKEEHSSPLLVGLQAVTITLEISLEVSQKIRHNIT